MTMARSTSADHRARTQRNPVPPVAIGFQVIPPDPEPGWAGSHPDRALAFLYVSPRPCQALEELLQL